MLDPVLLIKLYLRLHHIIDISRYLDNSNILIHYENENSFLNYDMISFHFRIENQRQSLLRKDSKTQIVMKNSSDLKQQMEDEIRKQRMNVTQKRLLEGNVAESPNKVSIVSPTVVTRSVTGTRKILIRPGMSFSSNVTFYVTICR